MSFATSSVPIMDPIIEKIVELKSEYKTISKYLNISIRTIRKTIYIKFSQYKIWNPNS
jgi:hypothetical protein|tara:strand:+ start:65 stop:238 length:174 start_codon:yes stop_codon:yes gene_type:complete